MTKFEQFDELKKKADIAPELYRKSLSFLKTHTFNFKGEYYLVGKTYEELQKAKGSFKLIPQSFRALYSAGTPELFLVCLVVFENIEFEDKENQQLLDSLLDFGVSKLTRISSLFQNAPFDGFKNIKRMIGMDDILLYIDDIRVIKK
jgi:hypothetical protein